MSDGAVAPAGGAPSAAPAAPSGSAPAQPAQTEAPAWSEKDDAELVERFKKSPYGKRKVSGKEESVGSVDDLKRWMLDSQRGVGANRVVEQAKKEAAEAAEAKREAAELKKHVERLKRGDASALRDLGIEDPSEMDAQRQVFESLSPEAKQLLQHSRQLEQQLNELRAKENERLEAETRTKAEQTKAQVLKAAREAIPQILADVDPSKYDLELPAILDAMHTLKETGLKLGVDYTPEQLKAYVSERREASVWGALGNVKPDVLAGKVAPTLAKMTPEALEAALGEHFVPLAKAIAKRWRERNGRGSPAQPPVKQQESSDDEQPRRPSPLTPMRW